MLARTFEADRLLLLVSTVPQDSPRDTFFIGVRSETDPSGDTRYHVVFDEENRLFDDLLSAGFEILATEKDRKNVQSLPDFFGVPLHDNDGVCRAALCLAGSRQSPLSPGYSDVLAEAVESLRECLSFLERDVREIRSLDENRNGGNLLRQAMELGKMAYWVYNLKERRVVSHSTTLFKMMGLPEPPLQDWSDHFYSFVRQAVHPDDFEVFWKRYYEDDSAEKHFTFRLVLPQEKTVYCTLHSIPLFDGNGCPESRISVIQDITEQKKFEMSLVEQDKALREKEFRYRMLYDHSNDAIHVLDHGIITACNRRTLDVFGYDSHEEFLGVKSTDLSPEFQPDGERSSEAIRKRIQRSRNREPEPFEWISRRKDGTTFESTVRLLPLPGNDDLFQVVVHDVTEQKAAGRALEYYRAYISLLAEIRKSFYSRSEQEIIHCFLETATHFFHLDKAWYGVRIGNSIRPIFHAGKERGFIDVARVEIESTDEKSFPLIRAVNERRPVALEYLEQEQSFEPWKDFLRQSGFRSCLAVPVEIHGKIEGGIVFYSKSPNVFDVSIVDYLLGSVKEQTRIISEKRRWSQQQRTLKKAKETAEAAAHAKAQFLANMSHEIRTPMTSILGYSEILLRDHLALTEGKPRSELTREDCLEILAESKGTAQYIQSNAEFLLSILNEILDFSKIEAEKLNLELQEVSTVAFLNEVMSLYSGQTARKDLKFTVKARTPVPNIMTTDPVRLKQVLVNLLGNAFKFTRRGEVEVTISWTRDEFSLEDIPRRSPDDLNRIGGNLLFSIRDTGIGIPANQLPSLFTPFHQADASTTRRFGGTGLGLAISKRLIQLLGGDLTVTSREEQGSVFTVILPQKYDSPVLFEKLPDQVDGTNESYLPQTSNAVASPKPSPLAPLAGYRILLAEDGRDNQRLFSIILKKAGAEVILADHGRLAVEIVLESLKNDISFSMILMDMQMPVMDGYTATRLLRENGYGGPIVALTAHALQEERQKCLEAGCNDYATKPILRDALIAAVLKNASPINDFLR